MATDIVLSSWELEQRGTPYAPIRPVPEIYGYVGNSRSYGPRRNGAKARIAVLHTTESPNATVPGSLRYDARRPETISATAFVGEQGIGYSVPESHRPFTQSRWNDEALSIEIIGTANWTPEQWLQRQKTLDNVERLLRDWRDRLGIPMIWLTPEQVLAGKWGVCDHLIANEAAILEVPSRKGQRGYTHWDIGNGLRHHAIPMIQRLSAPVPQPKPPPTVRNRNMIIYKITAGLSDSTPGAYVAFTWNGGHVAWLQNGDNHLDAMDVAKEVWLDDPKIPESHRQARKHAAIRAGQRTTEAPSTLPAELKAVWNENLAPGVPKR